MHDCCSTVSPPKVQGVCMIAVSPPKMQGVCMIAAVLCLLLRCRGYA